MIFFSGNSCSLFAILFRVLGFVLKFCRIWYNVYCLVTRGWNYTWEVSFFLFSPFLFLVNLMNILFYYYYFFLRYYLPFVFHYLEHLRCFLGLWWIWRMVRFSSSALLLSFPLSDIVFHLGYLIWSCSGVFLVYGGFDEHLGFFCFWFFDVVLHLGFIIWRYSGVSFA